MTEPAHRPRAAKPPGLYQSFWRYAAGDRGRTILFMTLLILAQLLKLAIPYLSGAAVQAMQGKGDAALGTAGWDMALIFVVCAASWVLHGPARVLERFVAIRVHERFADALYRKATRLPLDWHQHHHSGETIEHVQKAGGAIFGFAQNQFVYLQNAVSLIGPIVAIFVLSVPTGGVALFAYALIFVVLVRFDGAMIRLKRAQNRAQARYVAALVDCLGNIATVLTLRLQQPTRRLLASRMGEVFAPLRSSVVLNEAKWCAIDLLNNGIRSGLVVLYAWLAWRQGGPVLLGSAVMVYQYAQQVGGVVSNMAGNYQDLVGYKTDLDGAHGIFDAAEGARAAAAVAPSWREIGVERLRFRYPQAHGKGGAVDIARFILARGRRIALVGESGSGKSSLLRLLAGLYTANEVRFLVDGKPAPELPHLGSIAMLAPQDPEIFEGSIGHNLTLGIDYDPAEIRHALDLAVFAPVVEALPAGLATDIAERGLNLSGGQKQRLALARAILAASDASLLLLDEPTSNLDPATEARVYANLFAAAGDACVVSSVHRLHLLDRFDEIVLMEGGEITAIGTLAELLEHAPRFLELWQRCAGGPAPLRIPHAAGTGWRVAAGGR
ncbi:MAG TPA: ABC transporter ATP-binding protein [Stellaceae bacterium]|nr:ABC transporter ATP-binding protein [Stellaceae bacterium]